jgi:hypothetical protein
MIMVFIILMIVSCANVPTGMSNVTVPPSSRGPLFTGEGGKDMILAVFAPTDKNFISTEE